MALSDILIDVLEDEGEDDEFFNRKPIDPIFKSRNNEGFHRILYNDTKTFEI